MKDGNRRAVVSALVANLGIAIAKFAGFLATGAASMLAEAVHSLADTANQALLLWGNVAARRTQTAEHPFGHGRERYFWSFVVALVIFSLGGLFAFYQGVQRWLEPHEISSPGWAIAILLVGIGLEGNSLRVAIREATPYRADMSWWNFIRHSRQPELPVVLLEDLGALAGLVVALFGIALAMSTGDTRWDAVGSITIGILLILIAGVLAIEMKSLLIGESAAPGHVDAVHRAIDEVAEVERLIHLRTLHLGPDQLLIAMKVELNDELSFEEVTRAIDAVEARIRARLPIAEFIYVEPAVFDPNHARLP